MWRLLGRVSALGPQENIRRELGKTESTRANAIGVFLPDRIEDWLCARIVSAGNQVVLACTVQTLLGCCPAIWRSSGNPHVLTGGWSDCKKERTPP